MSGTPVSTEYSMDAQGYLPFNRGDLGRTPFLWFANLYVEYNLKLGKNNLNINVNVDNVFNTRTAQRIYQIYNSGGTASRLRDHRQHLRLGDHRHRTGSPVQEGNVVLRRRHPRHSAVRPRRTQVQLLNVS